MLTKNVGTLDRAVRVLLGLGLLSLLALAEGGLRWVGLIGLVPLLTAAIGSCPIYSMLGVSTCPAKPSRA